jgi:DNA-binding transcriptional ArsR family regulator
MAVTIELQPRDLENIRFAYSPLLEAVFSYMLLSRKRPELRHINPRWGDEADRALYGIDFPYMDALIPTKGYIADFITPTPVEPQTDMDAALVEVLATPPEIVRKFVQYTIDTHENSETRQHFMTYPAESLYCLTEELRLYWQRTLAHHWSRIRTVLDNDILFRARAQALTGAEQMTNDLSDDLSYRTLKLLICKSEWGKVCGLYDDVLRGDGIQFVPSVFKDNHVSWQTVPEYLPMVIYGARGGGLWYQQEQPEPEHTLRAAFGDARAALLAALSVPAHTAELAQKLGITSGAVSQQLAKLGDAGLVESHRSSYHVFYRLSERGEKLMTLFATG